jgi:AcrR family transcriptional regulator
MHRQRLTRAERQAQTRRELLDAAARVFVRRGFTGSSVEEISAEAGYTRGAFYSNFSSKDEILVELLHDRVYARYTNMVQESLQDLRRAPTPRELGEILAGMQAEREGQLIAMDIGLAIQNFVDHEDAPLELYPELFVLLFRPLFAPTA